MREGASSPLAGICPKGRDGRYGRGSGVRVRGERRRRESESIFFIFFGLEAFIWGTVTCKGGYTGSRVREAGMLLRVLIDDPERLGRSEVVDRR